MAYFSSYTWGFCLHPLASVFSPRVPHHENKVFVGLQFLRPFHNCGVGFLLLSRWHHCFWGLGGVQSCPLAFG